MANFTKQAIKTTFLRLLGEQPLSEISVKTIVENCGINRKSFYYHYQDIHALLEEIIVERADNIIKRRQSLNSVEDCLAATINSLLEDKRLVLHIYRSVSRESFERNLLKVCDYVIRSYMETIKEKYGLSHDDAEILAGLYRGECFGLIAEWILNGMQSDILGQFHRACGLRWRMTAADLMESGSLPASAPRKD